MIWFESGRFVGNPLFSVASHNFRRIPVNLVTFLHVQLGSDLSSPVRLSLVTVR